MEDYKVVRTTFEYCTDNLLKERKHLHYHVCLFLKEILNRRNAYLSGNGTCTFQMYPTSFLVAWLKFTSHLLKKSNGGATGYVKGLCTYNCVLNFQIANESGNDIFDITNYPLGQPFTSGPWEHAPVKFLVKHKVSGDFTELNYIINATKIVINSINATSSVSKLLKLCVKLLRCNNKHSDPEHKNKLIYEMLSIINRKATEEQRVIRE